MFSCVYVYRLSVDGVITSVGVWKKRKAQLAVEVISTRTFEDLTLVFTHSPPIMNPKGEKSQKQTNKNNDTFGHHVTCIQLPIFTTLAYVEVDVTTVKKNDPWLFQWKHAKAVLSSTSNAPYR